MAFEFGEVETNFNKAAEWIADASGHGSDLVLLPELWASGYDLSNWLRYATPLDEGLFPRIADLAKEYKIAVGCSLLEERDGKAFNTFVIYGPDGTRWGEYRKIHRFRLLEEEKWLGAGESLGLIDSPWGPIGLAVCYDLRFPEMFRPYALAGSKLILIVAEWPERRVAHWSKLLMARAIENQCFVAGTNKVGESLGAKLGGRSAVIDPWGETLVEGDDQEALLTVEIELKEADKARRFIPVFKDRRTDLY
ncbi:MAG: carbon-nitrogen family hydrolase [Anaerolineales bacterium]|nr:carbon-nitrogen family hydrolase [Chloroflexota bacterium]MBL6983959.1 carbon-nitrogen family hydrolase [Anaerolineales bacterium]